eukprot:3456173-Pleurochrysis_carterae.AAC.1
MVTMIPVVGDFLHFALEVSNGPGATTDGSDDRRNRSPTSPSLPFCRRSSLGVTGPSADWACCLLSRESVESGADNASRRQTRRQRPLQPGRPLLLPAAPPSGTLWSKSQEPCIKVAQGEGKRRAPHREGNVIV